jgi:hypothetical protein
MKTMTVHYCKKYCRYLSAKEMGLHGCYRSTFRRGLLWVHRRRVHRCKNLLDVLQPVN